MVTGYEAHYYNDITRICNYLQTISQNLEKITILLAEKQTEELK